MILVTRSAFSYPTVSKMVFHKLLLQIGFLGHFKGLKKKKKKPYDHIQLAIVYFPP